MQPLYITNPTRLTAQQWKYQVATEPITKLCIRHIVRELVSLEFEITCDKPEEQGEMRKYLEGVLNSADDGDGWDVWLSRMLQDALILPIAGNSEVVANPEMGGIIGGLYHIDGETLYPTYDRDIPFVQINPYNGLDRVYFARGDVIRLITQPRTDLTRKVFQEAPVESAFLSIEALSRIYIYYLKQLGNTPMAGILDVMDMSPTEAIDWAKGFREMWDDVDPMKVPLLYDHTKPARFIPLTLSPADVNMIENFKRFAEMVCGAFGLSIGDLRLFEHDRTLAGAKESQKVSTRSGTGFYAQLVEDLINNKILMSSVSGFRFRFKIDMTGESTVKADLASKRATILMTLTGNQPILKPADAQKQLKDWEVIDIEMTGLPSAPGLEGMGSFPSDSLESIDQDHQAIGDLHQESTKPDALSQIEQVHNEMQQYAKSLAEDLLADSKMLRMSPKTVEKFSELLKKAFQQSGKQFTVQHLEQLLKPLLEYKSFVEDSPEVIEWDDTDLLVEKATAAERLDDVLNDQDWYDLPDIQEQLLEILRQAYTEGSLSAVQDMQQQMYEAGLVDRLGLPPEFEFILTNPSVINLLNARAATLVQHVDDGTRYFLRQNILTGYDNGWSTSDIVKYIQANLFGIDPTEAQKLSESRIRSIVNTELNWADSRAMLDQMIATGLKTKGWVTRGHDVCEICLENEDQGFVPLDFEYLTVFPGETTLHPPGHPMTCHCNLTSNADEFKEFVEAGGEPWDGGENRTLQEILDAETQRIIEENRKATQKSLPMQSWGQPDQIGNRSRFESIADAQHYLQQYSLVPVISDSDIDVKGGNYTYAGVIWGTDIDKFVEAALLPVDEIPWRDIKSGRARIFGAKGIKSSKSAVEQKADHHMDTAMIALSVPPEIEKLLDFQKSEPHITVVYLGKMDHYFDPFAVRKTIEKVCSETDEKSLTLTLTGSIISLQEVSVAEVKITPALKHLHDALVAGLLSNGQVVDKTWAAGGFKPHVTVSDNQLTSDAAQKELAVTWSVSGVWLYLGGEKEFYPFGIEEKHLPGRHDQSNHGRKKKLADSMIYEHATTAKVERSIDVNGFHPGTYLIKKNSKAARRGFHLAAVVENLLEKYGVSEKGIKKLKNVVITIYTVIPHVGLRDDPEFALAGVKSGDVVITDDVVAPESIISKHQYKFSDKFFDAALKARVEQEKFYYEHYDGRIPSWANPSKGLAESIFDDVSADTSLVLEKKSQPDDIEYLVVVVSTSEKGSRPLNQQVAKSINLNSTFLDYAAKVPGQYRKDFEIFVRSRTKVEDVETVDASELKRLYEEFLNTMLNYGFEYYKPEMPALIRSVVKSESGKYEFDDELPAVVKNLIVEGELVSAAKQLQKDGYTISKAFYTGIGYSGVHDPDDGRPPDLNFFNRGNFEKIKRLGQVLIDGRTVRVEEPVDNAGDPVIKLTDVMAFNSEQGLEQWLQKVKARPVGRQRYQIEDLIEGDNTWPTLA